MLWRWGVLISTGFESRFIVRRRGSKSTHFYI
ncbi:hypothetical protein [Staphylococcus phage PT1-4]